MTTSNTELLAEIDKQQRRNRSIRERASEKAEAAGNFVGTVIGGGLGGIIDQKAKGKEIAGISYNWLAGAALGAVGLMDYAGKHSSLVASLGAGILAFEAGKLTYVRMGGTVAGEDDVGALPMRRNRRLMDRAATVTSADVLSAFRDYVPR